MDDILKIAHRIRPKGKSVSPIIMRSISELKGEELNEFVREFKKVFSLFIDREELTASNYRFELKLWFDYCNDKCVAPYRTVVLNRRPPSLPHEQKIWADDVNEFLERDCRRIVFADK